MPETSQRLVTRLENETQKTVDFFRSLSDEQMHLTVYSDHSCWTSQQILAHFVSAEKAFSWLIEDVLGGGSGAPESFDIDAFNDKEVATLQQNEPAALLHRFEILRRENILRVSRMSLEDLARIGRHPFLGIASLEDIIQLLYRHNQIHQRDIRKRLTAENGDLPE